MNIKLIFVLIITCFICFKCKNEEDQVYTEKINTEDIYLKVGGHILDLSLDQKYFLIFNSKKELDNYIFNKYEFSNEVDFNKHTLLLIDVSLVNSYYNFFQSNIYKSETSDSYLIKNTKTKYGTREPVQSFALFNYFTTLIPKTSNNPEFNVQNNIKELPVDSINIDIIGQNFKGKLMSSVDTCYSSIRLYDKFKNSSNYKFFFLFDSVIDDTIYFNAVSIYDELIKFDNVKEGYPTIINDQKCYFDYQTDTINLVFFIRYNNYYRFVGSRVK